jgi:hypothetical protein
LDDGVELRQGDSPGEYTIVRDRSVALADYRRRAHAIAEGLASDGVIVSAVVTFARPLSPAEFEELDIGWAIHSIEAVSAPLADGDRVSFGDDYSPMVWDNLAAAAAEESVTVEGVIAATVTIDGRRQLGAALRSGDVYLVDAASERLRRHVGDGVDVGTNDVYWELAGLD